MKPILRDFPDRFESERLIIRSPLPGDGAALHKAVIASQKQLQEWLVWAVNPFSAEEYEVHVRKARLKFLSREDLALLLVLKESGEIIGGSGLHRIDWEVPRFEIGYWLHTAHTGRGLMTEAVRAIDQFAFHTLGAKRVEIQTDTQNLRSIAVARRVGYTLEATLRHHRRHHLHGDLRDFHIFARLADT